MRRGPEDLRHALREGPDLPRQLLMVRTPTRGRARRCRTQGRDRRGHSRPVLHRLPRSQSSTVDHSTQQCGPETRVSATRRDHRAPLRQTATHGSSRKTTILRSSSRRLPIITEASVEQSGARAPLEVTRRARPEQLEFGRDHRLDEAGGDVEDRRMTGVASAFAGLTALQAREAVIAACARKDGSTAPSPAARGGRTRSARGSGSSR